MDNPPYEQATNELRQVRHTRAARDMMAVLVGEVDTWYTVQRKWLVFDGVSPSPKDHFVGTLDGTMINNVVGRPVWRDLPTVSTEEAKQDSLA